MRKFTVYYTKPEYFGSTGTWPKLTVAVMVDDLNKVFIGVAYCSVRDSKNFVKKLGRTIAEGRLSKHPICVGEIPERLPVGEARYRVIAKLVGDYVKNLVNLTTKNHRCEIGKLITNRQNYRAVKAVNIELPPIELDIPPGVARVRHIDEQISSIN